MPNVLIIDDDESICETLRVLFERNNAFHVDVVHSGREGIVRSREKFYNVACVDIKLPDMSGIELLDKLREASPKMLKIIITGYASLENAIAALNKGADAYIQKPFKPGELLVTIRSKLENQMEDLQVTQEKVADFIKERVRILESEPNE